jgi:hypothetical protein
MRCVMDCRGANIPRYGFQRCECLASWIAEERISHGMAFRDVNALRHGLQRGNIPRYGFQRCECLALWIAEGRISHGMAFRGVNVLHHGLQRNEYPTVWLSEV